SGPILRCAASPRNTTILTERQGAYEELHLRTRQAYKMSANEGRVFVRTWPTVKFNHKDNVYAAEIADLGLSAHGRTPGTAIDAVIEMFVVIVDAHRRAGTLKFWLDQSGLKWHWEKDRPKKSAATPKGEAHDNSDWQIENSLAA